MPQPTAPQWPPKWRAHQPLNRSTRQGRAPTRWRCRRHRPDRCKLPHSGSRWSCRFNPSAEIPVQILRVRSDFKSDTLPRRKLREFMDYRRVKVKGRFLSAVGDNLAVFLGHVLQVGHVLDLAEIIRAVFALA